MEFIEKLYTGSQTTPIQIYCCGRRLSAPNHRFGPADRAHFWMIYLKEGSGTFTMSGLTHRIEAGDMFVAYPNRRIQYIADNDSVWSIYWLSIDENGMLPFLKMLGVTEKSPICHTHKPLAVECMFEALLGDISTNTLSSYLLCSASIYQMFSYFVVDINNTTATRNYIDEAIFFLTNHSNEQITIADCANVIGINQSYFARLFKKQIGMTPSSWLTAYRLDRAAMLLRETDLKIYEISIAVGIHDQLYFSRCFSQRFGMSPTEYRKESLDT